MTTNDNSNSVSFLQSLFSLQGRVAVVTGGTSGIGQMIAKGLVRAGATTYVTSRKSQACEETASALSEFGTCHALPGDVGTQEGCTAIGEAFRESEDNLHILINGAGTTWGAPLAEYPDSAWDKVLGVNVKGTFHMSAALLPELKSAATQDRPSKVINIGSVHGFVPPEWETYAYSSSKGAVHQLTRHLAKQLGREHIVVNAIAPGPFESRMMAQTIQEHGEALVKESATGRLGQEDDMAGTAVYLASHAGDHLTGAVIPVDGGYGTTR